MHAPRECEREIMETYHALPECVVTPLALLAATFYHFSIFDLEASLPYEYTTKTSRIEISSASETEDKAAFDLRPHQM